MLSGAAGNWQLHQADIPSPSLRLIVSFYFDILWYVRFSTLPKCIIMNFSCSTSWQWNCNWRWEHFLNQRHSVSDWHSVSKENFKYYISDIWFCLQDKLYSFFTVLLVDQNEKYVKQQRVFNLNSFNMIDIEGISNPISAILTNFCAMSRVNYGNLSF